VVDQIEPYHTITSKPILSKNTYCYLKRHIPLNSFVYKAGASLFEDVGESLGKIILL
jgi:hypothetical protein